MGVPLQLILGILLALVTCSFAEQRHLRQIREAPPPPPPTPAQNVTEINNRDLNKIIKDNPKTEVLDPKAKLVNNVNNFEEFPLKLGEPEEDSQNNIRNGTEVHHSSKEVEKTDEAVRLNKEKLREENARAIDNDASKFWSTDFHSKNNVFTLPPILNVATIRPPESSQSNVATNAEQSTPTTKLFDQKFKETVESVEQNLDDVDVDNEENSSDEEANNDENLAVENLPNRQHVNSSLEYENTKMIVNNETIEKNSIHKDINVEQIKKTKFENTFNQSNKYDDEENKGEAGMIISHNVNLSSITTDNPVATTRKSSLLKEPVKEKGSSHLLSNNIETEFINPDKGTTTTAASSTIWKLKGDIHDIAKLNTSILNFMASTTEPFIISMTTVITTTTRTNISENIIPLKPTSKRMLQKLPSTESTVTNYSTKNHEDAQTHSRNLDHITVTDINRSTTDTILGTTETITDATVTNNILSDATISVLPEEGTTGLIIENATEISDTTETPEGTTLEYNSDNTVRTSKRLENTIVTEQMLRTGEKFMQSSTEEPELITESNIKNELDSTKVEETDNNNNTLQKSRDIEATTVESITITTTVANEEAETISSLLEVISEGTTTTQKIFEVSHAATETKVVINSTEEIRKTTPTTQVPITAQKEKLLPTTTEITFVNNIDSTHTTLTPEILSPNLNYSTSITPDNEEKPAKKIVLHISASEGNSSSSSSTAPSSTSEESNNITVTTEDGTETSATENSNVKDGEGEGGNKGKIAAIVISSVGAVCLILLAGLLYVMKKRQRRLNYGPRCRPVSLDDYSIDNLSVYNSVRRKGGARMSKRSFGNPAFDDPVAPTHPLNFPALAKFSTNFEDIKAEFEEIPQITARTSELPDGCDTKNRYANVIPLPETRVFLASIDGYPNSDYINANYVTGPKNIKGYYIATQGPMQNTVDDFWRMIWEQQAKVILMLTHLVENGLEKCVDYLPESEVLECSRLFGDFQITLKKREVKEKYIISSLQLKNMVSNSWREVTHFWYLGWPEKGVPNEANSLIAFLIEARSYMKAATIDKKNPLNGIQNGGNHNEHNPVVVHCSPGTGRTGVAIACDIAIREFETTRLVDIPKIVYRIRRDRANAIQTKEQYTFIYKVVSLYATKLTGGALDNL